MARLSRTQKYADLRDQLASDREDSVKSEDLNKYEDKLKSLEVLLNKNKQVEEKEVSAPITFEEPKVDEKSEEAKFDELIDKLFSKDDEEAPTYTDISSDF